MSNFELLFAALSLMMMRSGPGLWVLSQALLLLYFKMDNGSNVCGIEFNYNNNYQEQGGSRERRRGEQERRSGGGAYPERIIGLFGCLVLGANKPEVGAQFKDQLLCKLTFTKFKVQSEEGRSVHLSQLLLRTFEPQ